MRKGQTPGDHLVVICNFTPVPHQGYRVGVPEACFYREILNTDDAQFGGSGVTNAPGRQAIPHGLAKPALPPGTDPAALGSHLSETSKVTPRTRVLDRSRSVHARRYVRLCRYV